MSSNKQSWVGQAFPRIEDAALLTGNARYIDDLSPMPGIKHASFLRSPYPHARIIDIDVSAALKIPGVYTVLTGDDISKITDPLVSAIRAPATYYPIAVEKVRYVGEPVVAIVAETIEQAKDAAELVELDIDSLPVNTSIIDSIAVDAFQLHEEAPGNVCIDFQMGESVAVSQAFESADHITKIRLVNNQVFVSAMEPRAFIGDYDKNKDRYVIYTGSVSYTHLRAHET